MRGYTMIRVWIGVLAVVMLATPPFGVTFATTDPDDPAPTATVNEFLPEDRNLGDCLGAVERPGCGSEARGGWRQTLVFVLIVGGLAVIGWRVVASARRATRAQNGELGNERVR